MKNPNPMPNPKSQSPVPNPQSWSPIRNPNSNHISLSQSKCFHFGLKSDLLSQSGLKGSDFARNVWFSTFWASIMYQHNIGFCKQRQIQISWRQADCTINPINKFFGANLCHVDNGANMVLVLDKKNSMTFWSEGSSTRITNPIPQFQSSIPIPDPIPNPNP